MGKKKKTKQNTIPEEQFNPTFTDKHIKEKAKSPGVILPVKGFTEDFFENAHYAGIVEPYDGIPDRILRIIERKNPLVAAAIQLRRQQMREFSKISNNEDSPGWRIKFKDKDKTPDKSEKAEIQYIQNWFTNTGRTDFEGWQAREKSILDVMKEFVRERMTIDKVAVEIRRDRAGRPVDFYMLDAATIKPVLPGGYRGSKTDINPNFHLLNDKFMSKLAESKIDNVPDVKKIAYVQEISGRIVAAFSHSDLIFDISNERTDIRYYKQGFSMLERANSSIVSFLNGLTYNSTGLSKGAIPKIALAMGKESGYTTDQLEDLQEEWEANFQGADGMWHIPLLNGDVKVLDLLKNNRDMDYQKFMEFVGALLLAGMGVDPAELGLRFNQAQNVLNENQDAKQKFSKSRGLIELLGDFESLGNKILRLCGWDDKYELEVTGLNPSDKETNSKLRTEAVKSVKMVDEARAEEDLPPLPDGKGQVILDSVFMQNVQAMQMQQQGMGEEEGEEEDEDWNVDDDLDDIADEQFEKARTLLI